MQQLTVLYFTERLPSSDKSPAVGPGKSPVAGASSPTGVKNVDRFSEGRQDKARLVHG